MQTLGGLRGFRHAALYKVCLRTLYLLLSSNTMIVILLIAFYGWGNEDPREDKWLLSQTLWWFTASNTELRGSETMLIPLCQNQYLLNFTPVLLYLSLTELTSVSSWNWTLATRVLRIDTSPLATTELGSCLRNTTCRSCLYLLCLLVWCKLCFCKGKWQVTLCAKSLEGRKLW